jgi:hypothetical protein
MELKTATIYDFVDSTFKIPLLFVKSTLEHDIFVDEKFNEVKLFKCQTEQFIEERKN